MFGPTSDSRSTERGLKLDFHDDGPPLHWRSEIGRGYSAPVIVDGRLFLLHRVDDREICLCLDAETGETIWETAWPTAYRCPYPYSDGPYCTPIVDGEVVFVVGAEARMASLAVTDGTPRWERDLKSDFDVPDGAFGFGSTPWLEGDRLILNLGGRKDSAGIVALDRRTGETLWTATDEPAAYCTPIGATIHGRRYVFVLAQTHLYCLDPADGAVLWRERFGIINTPERVNAVSPLLIGDDRVLICSGPGPGAVLFQIDPDGTHREVWRTVREGLQSQYTNLWSDDGLVFGFSPRQSCELLCADAATGDVLWRWNHDYILRRSMTVSLGNRAICLDESGRLYTLQLDRHGPRLLSWDDLPLLEPPCFTPPALAHGKLYLRNERELLCLDLRPESTP